MKNRFKVIIAFLIIIVIVIVLIFLFKPFVLNNTVKNEVENGNISEFKDIEYNAYSIVSHNFYDNKSVIVSNVSELKKYTSKIYDENILDSLNKYDEEYFLNKALILLTIEEGSGSISDNVIGVNKNIMENRITVFIRRIVPEVGTDDMVTQNIIIEVDNEDIVNVSEIVIEQD